MLSMLMTIESSSDGFRVSSKIAYVFALDELLGKQLDKDLEQRLIADEQLHDLGQWVLVVVRPKLGVRD